MTIRKSMVSRIAKAGERLGAIYLSDFRNVLNQANSELCSIDTRTSRYYN